ncbi:MAG: oligosaccharide flippase family protein, partial [Clostridia bacterium]|nr:oligosaccharide flippase family protein [Clostridia bacterium]
MKNSFIKGAAILMVANAVSKILGAVLKIPLTYIIHEEGMAVYNTAFSVYAMLLSFVMSGVPFAVSKM